MEVINCDHCNKDFNMEIKEELLKDNISKVYFNCPHCNKEYISYYTNVLIKLKQKKIKNLILEYEKVRGKDFYKAEKLIKRYQKLKKEIGKDMDSLEKRAKL